MRSHVGRRADLVRAKVQRNLNGKYENVYPARMRPLTIYKHTVKLKVLFEITSPIALAVRSAFATQHTHTQQ